ncbi:MAG TPA: hypothetical protein VMK42_12070, partial [Anaeromyxobacteraceae bacterium]|nr:hypothetical protein [Anaeromyxobacteraceae bacterium]
MAADVTQFSRRPLKMKERRDAGQGDALGRLAAGALAKEEQALEDGTKHVTTGWRRLGRRPRRRIRPSPQPPRDGAQRREAPRQKQNRGAAVPRPGRVGMGNPTPLAGSCCSLDAARRSSGFAAGNAAAAFRTSSVS